MNSFEIRMLDILKELKQKYNVYAIKSEFEAEGTRTDEMIRLNELIFRADLQSYIKIGGCEAVRDLDQAKLLGVGGVMAPMIESPFAMMKFKQAYKKVFGAQSEVVRIINIETKDSVEHLDEILEEGKDFLSDVVVGRVDLSASMGLTRNEINGDIMLKIVRTICEKTVAKGFRAAIGGGVSMAAVPFIESLGGLIDRCETRKVVFPVKDLNGGYQDAFHLAQEFELLYLKNKSSYYDHMALEDAERIKMIEARLNNN